MSSYNINKSGVIVFFFLLTLTVIWSLVKPLSQSVIVSDAEGAGSGDLERKIDLFNGPVGAERGEQARRQMQYITHCEYRCFFIFDLIILSDNYDSY